MELPAKSLSVAKLVLDRERPELDLRRPEDRRLYVPRGERVHEGLITEAQSAAVIGRPFRWFFTGHTGTGKSTELNRLIDSSEITAEYLPHLYSVRENLDVHNLDFTDLILGMAQSVVRLAEEQEIKVEKGLKERMERWGTETELESELGGTGTAKGTIEFNAIVFKAGAEVQAGGEKRRIVREKLSESLTDFIKLIDELVDAVAQKAQKRVLVVIDTLDHVDHGPIRDIFTNYWASLSQPKVSLLIVIPLPMLHEQKFMARVEGNCTLLPNVKVFDKPGSERLDPDGFAFFKQVLSRLADINLFSEKALKSLFRLSGGMLRDMIGAAGDACKYGDLDRAKKVTVQHVARVLNDRKAFYRRVLTQADYDVLELLRDNPYPMGFEGLGPLLHLKAVIYYPNGEGWYALHPAVDSILAQGRAGAISG